jgi:serine/threonine protein kinase
MLGLDNLLTESDRDPADIFDIQELLGAGAFGTVFKCTLKYTSLVFALKIIQLNPGEEEDENNSSPPSSDGKRTDTIKREIEWLKSCKHENIVQYHACYRSIIDDSIWILTEFCAAGSIHDCIRLCRTTFSERQIARVMQDALKGLGYLHSKGIIHRDIKVC